MILSQPKQAHWNKHAHWNKQVHLHVQIYNVRALSGTTASNDTIMMVVGKHPDANPLGRDFWDDLGDGIDGIASDVAMGAEDVVDQLQKLNMPLPLLL
tara:strand:- start:86 stop:379 length:294 start_codon:yes stop_codon:yes gene_type:complete